MTFSPVASYGHEVVCGAKYLDEASWSDDIEGDDAAKSMRWSIKLIDFGFARPLRPDDIVDENIQKTKKEPRDEFFGRSTVNTQLDDKSIHKTGFGFDLSNSGKDLSTSISRFKITSLSAVGNRNFAAPEIKKGIRVFKRRGGAKKTKEEQEPLSECVSDYGMIVDAFSTGATIRYMCTGIPPQISVDEFMQEKNSALKVFGRNLKKAIKKDNDKRKKRYRSNNELPSEAVRLILGMTHWNEKKRTSVRSARAYEWIASSYTMKNASHTQSEEHGAKLDFLECAMKTQEKQES
jgi:serine/threonine protein kinase